MGASTMPHLVGTEAHTFVRTHGHGRGRTATDTIHERNRSMMVKTHGDSTVFLWLLGHPPSLLVSCTDRVERVGLFLKAAV